MRELSPEAEALQRYEAAVATGEHAVATASVQQMLDTGADPVTVLTNVIAAAQRAGGARWQRGEWSVAQEHASTAMAITATQTVMRYVRRTPPTRGQVIVACAEREWHALPAMMIDCALRFNGWDTTLLGAATTPMRLSQQLQDLGPEAVAVSCSMLGALPTTRRFIEASTAAGVPAVVGGAAFGPDDFRARALGATAWARDAQGAIAALEELPAVVPPAPPLPTASAREQAALEQDHRKLVATLWNRWSLTSDAQPVGEPAKESAVAAAEETLHQALHAVSAALLTGDPRPVSETSAWIAELLRSRGVDMPVVRELGELLVVALQNHPQAAAVVEQHFATGLA